MASEDRVLGAIGVSGDANEDSSLESRLGAFRQYERPIAHFRNHEINIIQIGMARGATLTILSKYFPRAHIVGAELSASPTILTKGRQTMEVGAQDDPLFLEKLCAKYPPTIFIADGAVGRKQVISNFETVFPKLLPGGVHIIENGRLLQAADVPSNAADRSPADYFGALAAHGEAERARGLPGEQTFGVQADLVAGVDFVPGAVVVEKKGGAKRGHEPQAIKELGKYSANTNKILIRLIAHLVGDKQPLQQINRIWGSVDTGQLDAEDYLSVSTCQLHSGLWSRGESESLMVDAAARFPNDFHVAWRLGHVKLVRGEYAGAVASLKRAIAIGADGRHLGLVHEMLGELYEKLSMPAEAIDALQAASRIADDDKSRADIESRIGRLRASQRV